ncbi:MAG: prephenate dehydrogenase/arogenate dehydrogenase family protein [Candidatus Paceibacterota bacterium]|jgi:prephenate dehydrogenase
MNTKIAVLGPQGTYGHEAGLKAISRFGLGSDCEVVFVGKNDELVPTAIENSSFALVPVENSTAGVVSAAEPELFKLMSRSSQVSVIGELSLAPSHCLLTRPGVDFNSIKGVLSHSQALEQCKGSLLQLGIGERISVASTALAAEMVAKEERFSQFAAIASGVAGEVYRLKVLSPGMADRHDNRTRFYLIGPKDFPADRKIKLAPKKIGIIGVNGRYGRWLKRFFEELGCEVRGSDVDTELSNRAVIEWAEVVCFAVSLEVAEQTIRALAPLARKEQLLLDVTSIKTGPVTAMMEAGAEVVGMHPMCAPTVKTLRGQTVVLTIGRLATWGLWFHDLLCNLRADVKVSTPEEHDEVVACVQGLPHIAILAMAATVRTRGVNVLESLDFTSPFYKVVISLMGRLLTQDPKLYAEIQMANPHSLEFLRTFRNELDQLIEVVASKDRATFIEQFQASRDHFGPVALKQGFDFFEYLIQMLVDLAEANSIRLSFSQDHPGLLMQISQAFADQKVNMSIVHSSWRNSCLSFLIGLQEPKFSPAVIAAIETIKSLEGATVDMKPSFG